MFPSKISLVKKGVQDVAKNANWDVVTRMGTRVYYYAFLPAHVLLYGSVCCK
jgi:hypothetical protein